MNLDAQVPEDSVDDYDLPDIGDMSAPAEADAGQVDALDGGVDMPLYPVFESEILPIMSCYCLGCHSETPAGGAPQSFRLDVCVAPTGSGAQAMATRILSRTVEGENGYMPPGQSRALTDTESQTLERWVAIGAPCNPDEIVEEDQVERYHPEGYADPMVHGPDLKMQMDDCRECHGETLSGGSTLGCDGCHSADWRTDCTFCHGGLESNTGAPPRGLSSERADVFSPHDAHVRGAIHGPYDCSECHQKPVSVPSENHVFDASPGRAEVRFENGLAAGGQYDGESCSNIYCHGNGREVGNVDVSQTSMVCSSCHASLQSGRDGWRRMSGQHEDHLREGIVCADCHGATLAAGETFAQIALHVNGIIDVQLPVGMRIENGQCSGSCHGEGHSGRRWSR